MPRAQGFLRRTKILSTATKVAIGSAYSRHLRPEELPVRCRFGPFHYAAKVNVGALGNPFDKVFRGVDDVGETLGAAQREPHDTVRYKRGGQRRPRRRRDLESQAVVKNRETRVPGVLVNLDLVDIGESRCPRARTQPA